MQVKIKPLILRKSHRCPIENEYLPNQKRKLGSDLSGSTDYWRSELVMCNSFNLYLVDRKICQVNEEYSVASFYKQLN